MTHRQETLEGNLSALWSEVIRTHFLAVQPTEEVLISLERRHRLVRNLLKQYAMQGETRDIAVLSMMDHFRTLLEAELAWLEDALASLQTTSGNHINPGMRRVRDTVDSQTQ